MRFSVWPDARPAVEPTSLEVTPPRRGHRVGRRLRRRPLHGRRRRPRRRRDPDARGARPRSPALAAAHRPASASARSCSATPTATRPCWPTGPPPSTSISGGRLLLGVGAGWQENEHEQYGIELPPPGERVDRFEEACQVVRRACCAEPTHDFDGRHYQLTDAICEPKPVQSPLPLLIGGKGDRMLGIVARYADEWNMWGLPDTIAERAAVLDAALRGASAATRPRSGARPRRSCCHRRRRRRAAASSRTPRRAGVAGTAERHRRGGGGWRDVGVDEVIVPDFTLGAAPALERLDALIEQVAPRFR